MKKYNIALFFILIAVCLTSCAGKQEPSLSPTVLMNASPSAKPEPPSARILEAMAEGTYYIEYSVTISDVQFTYKIAQSGDSKAVVLSAWGTESYMLLAGENFYVVDEQAKKYSRSDAAQMPKDEFSVLKESTYIGSGTDVRESSALEYDYYEIPDGTKVKMYFYLNEFVGVSYIYTKGDATVEVYMTVEKFSSVIPNHIFLALPEDYTEFTEEFPDGVPVFLKGTCISVNNMMGISTYTYTGVKEKEFKDYVKKLKAAGFTNNAVDKTGAYTATNADRITIATVYTADQENNTKMEITIHSSANTTPAPT